MSRRSKISFQIINDGKYTVIKNHTIAETNQRIKAAMKATVRVYKKKETESRRSSTLLVINT